MTLETQILALRLLFLAGLYLFLFTIVIVVWRELRANVQLGSSALTEQTGGRRLVVVEPGDTPLDVGDALPLHPVTSLGRDMANTVVLPDAGVSAQHALIFARDGHWWVEDQASTNGTFVNGARVAEPTLIGTGDVVQIGRVELRLA
jgi:hypothetical protein